MSFCWIFASHTWRKRSGIMSPSSFLLSVLCSDYGLGTAPHGTACTCAPPDDSGSPFTARDTPHTHPPSPPTARPLCWFSLFLFTSECGKCCHLPRNIALFSLGPGEGSPLLSRDSKLMYKSTALCLLLIREEGEEGWAGEARDSTTRARGTPALPQH